MHRPVSVVAVAGLLVLAGCLGGFAPGEDGTEPDAVDGELEVHHIDVGQADATLLVTPAEETILIDTGDWPNDGQDVIDYLEDRGIDRVDHLVGTHAHADHIGGHASVIEHVEEEGDGVGAVYDSGVAHTSQTYDDYLDAIAEYEVTLYEVVEGDTLSLEGATEATVLNPPADEDRGDLHYNSVTLHVAFGDFTYLTTGDAEVDAEQRMVDDHDDLAADVYQAGHHGSSTSTTEPFLEAADPEIAVVSSALESQYGHPHGEVLERFADRGVETYWTAIHGDVVVTTDGERVDVAPEHDEPTDPEVVHDRRDEAQGVDADARSIDGPGAPATP